MYKKLVKTCSWILPFLILFAMMTELHAQKGSKPTFQQYETHDTTTPLPDSPCSLQYRACSMTVMMILLLASSTVASLWLRSRRLIIVNAIVAIAVPGFYFGGCPCPVGAIQNITLGLTRTDYFIPVSVLILFVVPLFMTLLVGRTFCGSACPIGAIQELIALRPIKIPLWLESVLGLIRYIVLGLAVLFAATGLSFIICRYDPVVGLFRGGTGWAPVLLFSGVMLAIGVVVARPYCRFLCPYGALLALCGKLAIRHVTVSPGDCTQCRLCEQMCPYNAILPPSQDLSVQDRKDAFSFFALSLIAMPFIIAFSTALGACLAFPLAQLHPLVQRAELVRAEELGLVDRLGAFDETTAHYREGIENETLYHRAAIVLSQFRKACPIFGFWCGLVFASGLIAMATRKKRTAYEADPARCFSCGRCFWYCPNQKEKRFYLQQEDSIVPLSNDQ